MACQTVRRLLVRITRPIHQVSLLDRGSPPCLTPLHTRKTPFDAGVCCSPTFSFQKLSWENRPDYHNAFSCTISITQLNSVSYTPCSFPSFVTVLSPVGGRSAWNPSLYTEEFLPLPHVELTISGGQIIMRVEGTVCCVEIKKVG